MFQHRTLSIELQANRPTQSACVVCTASCCTSLVWTTYSAGTVGRELAIVTAATVLFGGKEESFHLSYHIYTFEPGIMVQTVTKIV